MFKKGKKAYGIFNYKCPRCHEGNLFETSTFSFQKPFEMNKKCSECGMNFEPEPGYYWGAMFISYIIWGWACLVMGFGLIWGLDFSVNGAFAIIILVSVIFFVWLFRISRSLWINLMNKYTGSSKI